MSKLKCLKIETSSEEDVVRVLASMIIACSLESFMLENIIQKEKIATREEAADFLDFLKSQKNLTKFHLLPSTADAVIEYWLADQNFKLKLSKLTFEYFCNCRNFSLHWKFLETQMKSLKSLVIMQTSFVSEELQDLLNLELEELDLYCCKLMWSNCPLFWLNSKVKGTTGWCKQILK